MTALLTDPQAWLAFATLTVLEIVLGVDNIIFISIMVSKLPHERQRSARISGLALAMFTRVALLYSIVWLTRLTRPLLDLGSQQLSGRDLILLGGGLFLLAKSVSEIHHALEGPGRASRPHLVAGFMLTVIQIAIIDIVFSLDSVFVAVGLAKDLAIMVAAIIAAILVMMWVAGAIGDFVDRHPTVKMLAQARIFLAMARHGLLPPIFGKVHPKFRTPHIATLITGLFAAIVAGLLPVDLLGELVSIGTLIAFIVVCIGVLVLRRTRPDLPRPFRVKAVWIIAPMGVAMCALMIAFLPISTWVRLVVWTAIGVLIYFTYSYKHSRLRNGNAVPI